MATTYYVDPDASGDDDGTSWINAWTTLARAIAGTDGTAPVAGDTVKCRGTLNVSTVTDLSTGNSGNKTDGFIYYIGCNALGENDGTYFEINGGGNTINIINSDANSVTNIWFENFHFTNADGSGLYAATNKGIYYSVIHNCKFSLLEYGVSSCTRMDGCHFHKCLFLSCTNGIRYPYYHIDIINCSFIACGYGIYYVQHTASIINCLFRDCTSAGIFIQATACVHGCIIHNCGQGITGGFGTFQPLVYATRVTSNSNGIDGPPTIGRAVVGYCYFDNTDDVNSDARISELTDAGETTNHLVEYSGDSADDDYGYIDSDADNYNLTESATLRSVAIELP